MTDPKTTTTTTTTEPRAFPEPKAPDPDYGRPVTETTERTTTDTTKTTTDSIEAAPIEPTP